MKKKIAVLLCISIVSTGLITGCQAPKEPETRVETEATTQAPESETVGETESAGETEGLQEGEEETAEVLSDTTVAGWHFVVEDARISKSLENVSVDLGYTGVETSDFVKEAGEGNTFCLIKMTIEKEGSKEVIDWASMKLTDSEGNEYSRIEDEFITDLGMTRMSGTALNFGSNEGWIAFEIKEGAAGLQLSYAFESETYTCDLSSVQ